LSKGSTRRKAKAGSIGGEDNSGSKAEKKGGGGNSGGHTTISKSGSGGSGHERRKRKGLQEYGDCRCGCASDRSRCGSRFVIKVAKCVFTQRGLDLGEAGRLSKRTAA
jgi:hypothetical protein